MKKNYVNAIVLLIGIFLYAGLKDFFESQGYDSAEAMWYTLGIIFGLCIISFFITIYVIKRRLDKRTKELKEKREAKLQDRSNSHTEPDSNV